MSDASSAGRPRALIGSLANDVMLVVTPLTTALSLLTLVLIVLAAVARDLGPATGGPGPL